MRFLILVTISLLFLYGCNTRIDGCLDANAENFDFNAERPCDGCCTYPELRLTLTQKWDDRNFANMDTLYDQQGQPYQIEDLRYFLSSWSWANTAGDRFTVDSIEAPCQETVLRYTPDNIIIDTRKFVYTLGTTRESPIVENVLTSLGLNMDFSCFDPGVPGTPIDLTDQSPLWNPATEALASVRLIIRKELGSVSLDTVFMDISSGIVMPYDLEFKKGSDTQLLITVDYARWFQTVDIQDLSSFEMSVNLHFTESIFPTP